MKNIVLIENIFYDIYWNRLFPVYAALKTNTLITLIHLSLWPKDNFRCGPNGVLVAPLFMG